ncbi:MAG: division/cell wall cluster transcriptional repressor MraZ [Melioribacteraceae bacterium]|jgi:MraZ protein|nr:division/cell wall cluster transcriptional repressor MraZ [Ignavibacteriota bacterium]MBZ0180961.1 division/cell wall cluster transcriptional repressor MraZ [Melioribacteraceae bacterium]
MFIGNFTYSIDAKGRVSIPAKLRKYVKPDANDSFVITRGTVQCIDVYPLDIWREYVAAKVSKLNPFDPQEAIFIRMFLQEASEDKLDVQSRLIIPKSLIEYAGIEKEVFILGAMQKIELWNPNIYQEYIKKSDKSYEEIAKEVMKM